MRGLKNTFGTVKICHLLRQGERFRKENLVLEAAIAGFALAPGSKLALCSVTGQIWLLLLCLGTAEEHDATGSSDFVEWSFW